MTPSTARRRAPRAAVLAAAALPFALSCGGGKAPSGPGHGGVPPRPNVVLITIESLRTDRVGALGGGSPVRPDVPVTPRLDALAAESVAFTDAHSVTSWTLSAHASLFTGLYPTTHRTRLPLSRLDASYGTLAESLAAGGYQTAGFASGPYLRREHALDQGFEIYDDAFASEEHLLAHGDVTNPRIEAAVDRFLVEDRDPARPFFLFVYLWDPHYDYLPPPPFDTLFTRPDLTPVDLRGFGVTDTVHAGLPSRQIDWVLSQYEGEIRCTDALVGRLLDRLEAVGVFEDTLIVVTADHGEEFFEHGEKGHKNNLYAESVRVPLIVRAPRSFADAPRALRNVRGVRDGRLASLVDVFPTVAEITGMPVPAGLHGRSLFEPEPPADRSIYLELVSTLYPPRPPGERGPPVRETAVWKGVRTARHKLVWSPDRGRTELFDVIADPAETVNLAADEPETLERVAAELVGWNDRTRRDAAAYRESEAAPLTDDGLERLKSLGYLGP